MFEQRGLHVKLDSAGTGSWHIGEAPCPDSIKVAKLHDIDISSLRARQVCLKDEEKFDFIIAMDENNRKDLLALGIKNPLKLGDFGFKGEDVPDPYYYKDFEGFEKIFQMISTSLDVFIEKKYYL
jgi:protein-tyrosine phosphatase